MTVFTGHTGHAGHFLQPTASAMGHRTTPFSGRPRRLAYALSLGRRRGGGRVILAPIGWVGTGGHDAVKSSQEALSTNVPRPATAQVPIGGRPSPVWHVLCVPLISDCRRPVCVGSLPVGARYLADVLQPPRAAAK